MPDILQHFERNTRGRDYVVGDIHGCFGLLRQALDAAGFDPDNDRLFTVGDLIDRGPDSSQVLEWLAEPWFHACLGNHEQMALESVHDQFTLLSWVLGNGGDWWLRQDAASQEYYLTAFGELPMAMEVETARGTVGVVHADIPASLSWQAFVDGLHSADEAVLRTALWGRQRASGAVSGAVTGIDQVVCGHTFTSDCRIHRVANVWLIDTGAFLAEDAIGHLTLLTMDSLFEDGRPAAVIPDRSQED